MNLVFFMVCFSLYLYKLGIAPQIQDLLGKVDFTGNGCGNQLLLITYTVSQKAHLHKR